MDWSKLVGAMSAALLATAANASAEKPFGLAIDQQVSGLDILKREQRFVVLRAAPAPAAPFNHYLVAENGRGEVCRVIAIAEFKSIADADRSLDPIVGGLSASYARPEVSADAILHFEKGAALVWRPLGSCSRDDLASEAEIKTCRSAFPAGADTGVRKVTLVRHDLERPVIVVRYDFINRNGCPPDPVFVAPSEVTLKRRP